ncbi:hypothetical protein GALL_291350 [mine drainage metagenome]|uniref:Outer membrane protein beta-barrel domain-containing protein n=1 Tax=mine drainage metagenome TaxID=410659 RepID=A0A1J5RA14_9ZZZZ
MKRLTVLTAALLITVTSFAQKDSSSHEATDTIKVGNFVIIKKNKNAETGSDDNKRKIKLDFNIGNNSTRTYSRKRRNDNLSTNWWIFDLGFANVRDNTNYTSAQSMGYFSTVHGAPVNQNSFALNTGKSSNVNVWIFMQKLNISQHVLNLKYGLGLEMYNFRYDHSLSYRNNPVPYVFNDTINFSKDKLYAGYLTVPLMLNINTTPHRHNGFSFSAGVSAGYLVGSHNKQISAERGKQKYHGDLGLQPWRFATIAELGLGPVRLYGSYSLNALHKESTGVDQFPYAVGVRFSNW